MSSISSRRCTVRGLVALSLLGIGLVPIAAAPSYADGPGFSINDTAIWEPPQGAAYSSTRATFRVALDQASTVATSVDESYYYPSPTAEPTARLVANPGPLGSRCAADSQRGQRATVPINVLTDITRNQPFITASEYEIWTSTDPLAVVAFQHLFYYDHASRDYAIADSVRAAASVTCSVGQPWFNGQSSLAYGGAGNTMDGGVGAIAWRNPCRV